MKIKIVRELDLAGKQVRYPDGTVETYTYSANGELIGKTDRGGFRTTYQYDRAGNRTAMKEFISSDGTKETYKLTKQSYDEAGRVLASETFLQEVEVGTGRITAEVTAGDRVQYAYDKAGRTVRVVGPNGRETVQLYDRAGNLLTKKQKIDDEQWDVKRYGYNFKSQLISESTLVNPSAIRNDALAGAVFDSEYVNFVLSTTTYAYDSAGRVVGKIDPTGGKTSYTYDLDGQVTKKTDPLLVITEYQYDLKGNLLREVNGRGVPTRYEYDALNRMIRVITPSADGGTATTRYLYDARGNLVKEIAPNQYDAALDTPGQAGSMAGIAYAYDAMNRRITTISPEGEIIEQVAYDPKGQVSKVVDGLRFDGSLETS